MSKSNRDIVLALIVLATLSGCSGGRLRQMFAPDREFMALSELEQPVDDEAIVRPSRGKLTGMLASMTKESRDDAQEEQDEEQHLQAGFLRRLLKSREEELPTDPFLDASKSDRKPSVVTAAKSQDVDDKADVPNIAPRKKRSTDKTAAQLAGEPFGPHETAANDRKKNVASAERTYGRPLVPRKDDGEKEESLSDLIAEFRSDEKLFPPSGKESTASDQMRSIRQEAEDGFNEFLESASSEDSADFARSSHNEAEDDFELDIAMLDKLTSPDALKERPSEFALPDALEDGADSHHAEALIQKTVSAAADVPDSNPFTDDESIDFASQDVVQQKAPLRSESSEKVALWESTSDSFAWDAPSQAAAAPFDDESLWSGFPETPVSVESTEPRRGTSGGQTTALSNSDRGRPSVPAKTASHTSDIGAAQGPFESDPFLADFQEQSDSPTGAAEVPSAGVAASGGSLGGITPRTWLLILAGVVVLYLLIVPERRNPPHPTNR